MTGETVSQSRYSALIVTDQLRTVDFSKGVIFDDFDVSHWPPDRCDPFVGLG